MPSEKNEKFALKVPCTETKMARQTHHFSTRARARAPRATHTRLSGTVCGLCARGCHFKSRRCGGDCPSFYAGFSHMCGETCSCRLVSRVSRAARASRASCARRAPRASRPPRAVAAAVAFDVFAWFFAHELRNISLSATATRGGRAVKTAVNSFGLERRRLALTVP